MELNFKIKIKERLYLKDPETSDLGRRILKAAVEQFHSLGFEHFTFKKLAATVPTTEATIYRYFENKHKLLIYLVEWYWSLITSQLLFHIYNVNEPKEKIKRIIDLLVWEDNSDLFVSELDHQTLYYIVIAEGSKAYHSKDVDALEKEEVFQPYKDLVELIAGVFKDYNKEYPFCKSLATTLVEMSHLQYFFMQHIPQLSDISIGKNPKDLERFLENLVFGALNTYSGSSNI
ncbi:TetR/AcrR family transcriptional regulator [Marinilongibacter aquaticus]|uniref:TetR/AcrR family transcriptional regulator n=1 Tax=Marinilongibacter aquaticus TaxID=2975157 RepID=UPI0021BDABF0|nr:TetR/AcrR family transcriptional regulator [Marinilongibacter aquaticus]UBM58923.1 TetR/AcrR family transcriptional regulator [Marinilongibacter aquaticus]